MDFVHNPVLRINIIMKQQTNATLAQIYLARNVQNVRIMEILAQNALLITT